MNRAQYLFSFQGRINRAKYWLAGLAMIGWMLLMAWLTLRWLVLVAHGDLRAPTPSVDFGLNIGDIFAIFDPAIYLSPPWIEIVMRVTRALSFSMLLWIYLATSIKRLHDRDKSGWWMVIFCIVPMLLGNFVSPRDGSYTADRLALVMLALYLWGIVELAFLRGTQGPNQFGPDPLAPLETGGATSSGWDQQSELEFVRHKAGPPADAHINRGHS